MVQGLKIRIPAQRSASKGRGRSTEQAEGKRQFPTTPNSIEKQKKMLQATLKKAMERNVKLKAHNRIMKEKN